MEPNMIDIAYTLTKKYPDTYWELNGDDYANLKWSKTNTIPKPTLEELTVKYQEVKSEEASVRYLKQREEGLPPLPKIIIAIIKQLNYMQMRGETDLIQDMDDIIAAYLKLARYYPKPESK